MSQDLYVRMLSDIDEKLDNLHKDVSELKDKFHTELTNVKTDQAQCKSRWSLMEKLTTLGIGSISLSGILSWLFGTHKQ